MKTQGATDFSSHKLFSVGLPLCTTLPFQKHGINERIFLTRLPCALVSQSQGILNSLLKAFQISSARENMVLIMPRPWIRSLYGTFTSELDSVILESSLPTQNTL